MLRCHRKKTQRNQNICIICNCCCTLQFARKIAKFPYDKSLVNAVQHAQTLRGASATETAKCLHANRNASLRDIVKILHKRDPRCCFCLTNIKLVNFACERNQSITPSTHNTHTHYTHRRVCSLRMRNTRDAARARLFFASTMTVVVRRRRFLVWCYRYA